MTYPMVSICIPTYNGEVFIAETMESAISQTYPNLEIIVSDDHSVDNTLEIVRAYENQTKIPIHIYNHKPNGIGANWNHCIKKANGDYIKFLFQDDVLMPACIEEMVNTIETDTTISIVASKRNFIVEPSFLDESAKKWIATYQDLQHNLYLKDYEGISYLDSNLFQSNTLLESPLNKVGEPTTILFRKSLVNEIGYFREDLKQVLDYEFCYRVLKKSKIAIINKKLVKFRLHNMQTTVKNKNNDSYAKDHEIYLSILYKRYFEFLNSKMKKTLSRKYNPLVKLLYNSIDIFKTIKPKTAK